LIGKFRADRGIEPDALQAHRASEYEARVAREREARHGSPGEASYA